MVEYLVAGLRYVGQADCSDGDAHYHGSGIGSWPVSVVASFLTALRSDDFSMLFFGFRSGQMGGPPRFDASDGDHPG